MKTHLKIFFLLLAGLAIAGNVRADVKKQRVDLKNNIREMIRSEVQNDLYEPFNFLYQEDVYKMDESVKIIFFLNEQSEMELKTVQCENCTAGNYVKQLLEKKKLDVDKSMTGKMYRIDIHLNYRAL
ncbi:MAG TPA: hypothetical protein PLK12_07755 [Prolixibacteraceae bacterium]|nr:hypothetical protein [Prolixibacteraceae bacterium]